ncbi:MAG: hypothetical protein IPH07_24260 [Deltaproteobacteria bacterium]|nr:hypothetical protein [Deltaproteobacteria bacterium]
MKTCICSPGDEYCWAYKDACPVHGVEAKAASVYDRMLAVQLRHYAKLCEGDSQFKALWAVLTQAAERLES